MNDRLAPPEVYPDEKGLRWHWTKVAVKYAYETVEAVRKLKADFARLQSDLSNHIGNATEEGTHVNEILSEMREDLKALEEKVEHLVTWRERVFGGWSVAKAILASSLVSTAIGTLIAKVLS